MDTLGDICCTLAESDITLGSVDTTDIAIRTEWASHPVWLAYATRLRRSRVMYFLPDMYDALVAVTGVDCGYYEVSSGDVVLRIVGVLEGQQPLGPFWDVGLTPPEAEASRARRCLDFGRAVQKQLSPDWGIDGDDVHRKLVRRLRWNLGDTDIHDLTMTRIVRVALGYIWRSEDKSLMGLAVDAINPEYDGGLDRDKLFTEWIAVHLRNQKDGEGGWALDIPERLRTQWNNFKQIHLGRVDLNDLYRDVMGIYPTVVRIRRNRAGEILQDCDVYIGRAVHRGGWDLPCSDWHNPFPRHVPLERYEKYLREERPDLMARLPELYGKRLGCWCKPELCHGDVLLHLLKRSVCV